MSAAYSVAGSAYFVVADESGRVVGGGGIAPLEGGEPGICELKKMYFLPAARGQGMGEALLRHCLGVAKPLGYCTCYLETLSGMDQAIRLYQKLGFKPLRAPLGATGHGGCDHWFALELGCPDRRVTEQAPGEPAESGPGEEGIRPERGATRTQGPAESGPGEEGIRPEWGATRTPGSAESGPGEEGIRPEWGATRTPGPAESGPGEEGIKQRRVQT
jgi:putative acetyltransferase